MKYVMIEIDCPGCGGEGYTENMTWLTYDGAQTWVRNQCHECHGNKTVEAPARCTSCGEEVLANEWVRDGDGYMCAYCANDDDDWEDIYDEAFARAEGISPDDKKGQR